MKHNWKTAKVFISSTFYDMHAERDYLVRFVFPRLREELFKNHIHIVDVDLRWGVTAEQNVIETCHEIIDECRPRFLCMLGSRYGSTPPGREHSITAQEIYYAVKNHSQNKAHHFFYFRNPSVTDSIPEPQSYIYLDLPGSPEQHKLELLKQEIMDAGYRPYVYSCRWNVELGRLADLDALGERVYTDLLESVNAEFGSPSQLISNEFDEESVAIEAFVETRISNYIVGDRQPIFDQLYKHVISKEGNSLLCLIGEPGSGKSALMGWFYRNYIREMNTSLNHRDVLVIPHFVGASAASSNTKQMLRRLCCELITASSQDKEIPDNYESLRDIFFVLVEQTTEKKQVVILIDAINQLETEDNTYLMDWLPNRLSPNIRIIMTSLPGPTLDVLRIRPQPPIEIALGSLSQHDAITIVDKFLFRYNKRLDAVQHTALLSKKDAGKPLYLIGALEELRTLGTSREITNRISALPDETRSLFCWILKRLEGEPEFCDSNGNLVGEVLVRQYFACLAASRIGMQHKELVDLIAPGDPQGDIAALQRLVRPYLMMRGALLDFIHGQFRMAVESVYLDEEQERIDTHHALATCFQHQADPLDNHTWHNGSPRGLSELAYHLLQSHNIETLEGLYADPVYLEAKCSLVNVRVMPTGNPEYGGIFELLSDLSSLLLYLEVKPVSISPQLRSQLHTLFDLLRERSQLFRRLPQTIIQEIGNYIDLTPNAIISPILLQKAQKQYKAGLVLVNKNRSTLPILGHSAAVTALEVSPSGEHFLSGGADGSVGYWQIDVEHPVWLINAHKTFVTWVAISPDGRRALSAEREGTLFLWNLELGSRKQILAPHQNSVLPWWQVSFCAFLDQEMILVEAFGGCRKIDLRTGNEVWRNKELRVGMERTPKGPAWVDFSPPSRRLVACGGDDRDITVADGETGKQLRTFRTKGRVQCLALSTDGSRLLVADAQGRLTGYNLTTGEVFESTIAHPLTVICRAPQSRLFFGCDRHGHILQVSIEKKLYIDSSPELDDLLYRNSPNNMISLPGHNAIIIGQNSGAITLFNTSKLCIQREWRPNKSLIKGSLFPDGQNAIGIEGTRIANNELHQGNALLFTEMSGEKQEIAITPHRHFISDVAAIDCKRALTVDRAGIAIIWQKKQASKVYEFLGSDFTACTGWFQKGLGIAGTLDENVIILENKGKDLPFLSSRYKVGIVALAVAGNPMCVFAAYFHGLVRFTRKENSWWGPQGVERHHSLRNTTVALDPSCTLAAHGNVNGEVWLWHCKDGTLDKKFTFHHGEITALSFNPDHSILYTAGVDRFIYGIDTTSKKIVYATVLPLPPIALRSEHDNWLSALDSNGNIYRFTTHAFTEASLKKINRWTRIKQLLGVG